MLNNVLSELRRRGVIQALTAYVVGTWLIIQVFDVVSPMFALPQWVNSLVGVVGIAGFPVAAYVSWFFDFSGGKLTRVKPHPEASDDEALGAKHWIGLLVIALAALAAGQYFFEQISDRLQKEEEGIKTANVDASIAVLPFTDLSPEGDQAYLADGLAEELSSQLGRIPDLRTAATSASFRLAKADVDPVAIGRRLNVATVLSGSVAMSGDRLRVRVELTNIEDNAVLWRDSFSRTLTDIFIMEEEIARSITNLLQDRYVDSDEISTGLQTASSDAYVFYLRARSLLRARTAESIKEARKLFEQSVGLDPEFAPAHVGLGETLWRLAKGGENFGSLDPKIASDAAQKNIERALIIDSELPEAYANLGRVAALKQDQQLALEHYSKAISLNPSLVDVYIWRYFALNEMQAYSDALAELEYAASLDPTAPAILHNLGFEYSNRGDFDTAREYFEQLIKLEPDNPLGHRGLADAAFRDGNFVLSLEQWDIARKLSPETPLYETSYRDVLMSLRMLTRFKPLAIAAGEETQVLLLEENYVRLHQIMDEAVALSPDDPWVLFEAAWNLYLGGGEQRANALILQADALLTDEDRFAMPMCSPAIELVKAHRDIGDVETAETYLETCRKKLERARNSVFVDNFLDHLAARIAVLDGEHEAAVKEMERAFDRGWLEWWTDRDPLLSPLKSQSGMARVLAKINDELDRQRALAELAVDTAANSDSQNLRL